MKTTGSSGMVKFQLGYKVSHPRQQQHTTQATPSTITNYATGPDGHRLHRTLLNYLSVSLTCATAVTQLCDLASSHHLSFIG
jgi:hypothetical protein